MESIGTNTAPEPRAVGTLDTLDAPDPAGAPDLVTVPTRQGLEAVDIIRRATHHTTPGVGPVLHDGSGDTLGFLVPPGTADAWDLPGSACTQTNGRGLRIGDAELSASPAADRTGWLLPRRPSDPSPTRTCCARRSARPPD